MAEMSLAPVHAAATALTLLGLTALRWAWRRRGQRGVAAVLVGGTLVVGVFQSALFPRVILGSPVQPVADQSTLAAIGADYRGTYLQLANFGQVTAREVESGSVVFGSRPALVHYPALNRYTGIGFQAFEDALCLDYRGSVCPEAFGRLWQPASSEVTAPLIDVLGVSTLSIQRSLVPNAQLSDPPVGWRILREEADVVIWQRKTPLTAYQVTGSRGVRAVAPDEDSATVSSTMGGSVVFSRLAWPGYSASVDGVETEVRIGPAGLLQVSVPPGEHAVRITYATPGLPMGWLCLGLGLVLALILGFERRHRADRAVHKASQTQPVSHIAAG